MFTLVRWDNILINARGPLGHRVWLCYMAESALLLMARQRADREWATYR
jgi:hypothetical protein